MVKTLRVQCCVRHVKDKNQGWSFFFNHYFKDYIGADILLHCDYDWKELQSEISEITVAYMYVGLCPGAVGRHFFFWGGATDYHSAGS